jgi:lipoyl synthase
MLSSKPKWLKAKLPTGPIYRETRQTVEQNHCTRCARVPSAQIWANAGHAGTATVMILGNICTRSCTFCAIQTGRPTELDLGEPLVWQQQWRK